MLLKKEPAYRKAEKEDFPQPDGPTIAAKRPFIRA